MREKRSREDFKQESPGVQRGSAFWFTLVIMYMVVDLAQFQLVVKPLSVLRPGLVVTVGLAGYVFCNWEVVRLTWTRQLTIIVLFVLLLFVLTPFARNNYQAFMTGQTMMLMLPFLMSISAVIYNKRRLIKLLLAIEYILLFLCLYSLSHGGKGPGGIMNDENDLTLFIVAVLPFVFFKFNQSKRTAEKIFHGVLIISSLLAVVNAFSRGGFVGFVCMLVVYWLFSNRKMTLLLAVGIMFSVLYLAGGDAYFDEMQTITNANESTANQRILSWEAGWRMFLDNPFGVGGNNFQVRFPEYQPEGLSRNMWGRVAHSLWFTLIPELGIMGVIFYGVLIFYNFNDIFTLINFNKINLKTNDFVFFSDLGTAYAASLAGFFGAASFISVLYYSHFWYLSMFIGSTVAFASNEKVIDEKN